MPFQIDKPDDTCKLPKALLQSIASYIDENYTEDFATYGFREKGLRSRQALEDCTCSMALPCAPTMASKASLADLLEKTDAGFTETLLKRIDETGKKDSEIYKKAGLSKQHFSKIRNNPHYQPTKPTAIALALALELDLEQTGDLLGRAGFALTNSSKFDLIVRYFIQQRNYNIIEINIALYEFDQPLLCE